MASPAPEPRASDADREAVAERLRDAVADGRLDLDEFEDRVTRAYAARTRPELVPLLADLPLLAAPDRTPVRAGPKAEQRINATLSSTVRNGAWHVPPVLEVRLVCGSAVLDLTATALPDLVDIDLALVLSSLELVVPGGVQVRTGAVRTVASSLDDRSRSAHTGPVVRLGGRAVLSSVRVRHPNPIAQWWCGLRTWTHQRQVQH